MATLTPSNSLVIQKMINDAWNDPDSTHLYKDFTKPTPTISALAENQGMKSQLVFEDGGEICTGFKAWWIGGKDHTLDHNSTTARSFAACGPATGVDLDSKSITYTIDKHLEVDVMCSDNLCANDIDFQMLATKTLLSAMKANRDALNTAGIDFLEANNMTNASSYGGYTQAGDITYIPGTWDSSILALFKIHAAQNQIQNYRIINGTNLAEHFYNSQFTTLNDNQRSFMAQLQSVGMDWDLIDLDANVGSPASFLYNPNMIGFVNMVNYNTPVPTPIPGLDNVFGYYIEDPVLKYKHISPTGAVTMKPVRYDVVYAATCDGISTNGKRTSTHKWEVAFRGSLTLGPATTAAETTILQFHNEAAP